MKIEFDRETIEKARNVFYTRNVPGYENWSEFGQVFADAANAQLQSAPGISVEELARGLVETNHPSNKAPIGDYWLKVALRAIELLGPGARLPTEAKVSGIHPTPGENLIAQLTARAEAAEAERDRWRQDSLQQTQAINRLAQAAKDRDEVDQARHEMWEATIKQLKAEHDKLQARLEKVRKYIERMVPASLGYADVLQKEAMNTAFAGVAREGGWNIIPAQPLRVVEVGDGEIPSKFLMPGSVAELNARGKVQP